MFLFQGEKELHHWYPNCHFLWDILPSLNFSDPLWSLQHVELASRKGKTEECLRMSCTYHFCSQHCCLTQLATRKSWKASFFEVAIWSPQNKRFKYNRRKGKQIKKIFGCFCYSNVQYKEIHRHN